MNRRAIVVITAVLAVFGFALASYFFSQPAPVVPNRSAPAENIAASSTAEGNGLVRPNSPVLGPADARVTIVEFFDPACESCRAFYPIVKQIMAENPRTVRVVLRYAAFHDGSEEVVRILETARLQGVFQPVLEALLDAQPAWASHGRPDLSKAWEAARSAGLDESRARRDMSLPGIDAILRQDTADVMTFKVRGTPTFFVNGKSLPSFGRQPLLDLVRSEVLASN
jgi:protein-disulfide isomerase